MDQYIDPVVPIQPRKSCPIGQKFWRTVERPNTCEHYFPGASIRPANRVFLRTADGTKVVTDYVKRVRLQASHTQS